MRYTFIKYNPEGVIYCIDKTSTWEGTDDYTVLDTFESEDMMEITIHAGELLASEEDMKAAFVVHENETVSIVTKKKLGDDSNIPMLPTAKEYNNPIDLTEITKEQLN